MFSLAVTSRLLASWASFTRLLPAYAAWLLVLFSARDTRILAGNDRASSSGESARPVGTVARPIWWSLECCAALHRFVWTVE